MVEDRKQKCRNDESSGGDSDSGGSDEIYTQVDDNRDARSIKRNERTVKEFSIIVLEKLRYFDEQIDSILAQCSKLDFD